MSLRIAGVVSDSITDGPGIRYTLFVQGCPHRCPGCHNPQTHDFHGGRDAEEEEIIAGINKNPLLSGLTLSGGEPMCQARALASLVKRVRAECPRIKEVACYTGYTFEELMSGAVDGAKELLQQLDILVDGKFIQAERSWELKFKGSKNQRVIDVPKSLQGGEDGAAVAVVLDNTDRWN